jgi:hypothetical protein
MNSYGNKSPYETYDFENKVIKKKKLDKVTLTVSENQISGKIFVEFFTRSGKLRLQRNFEKLEDAQPFMKSIKSADDLKKYFGLNQ